MSLGQSIVIVSEFSSPKGGGTRGSTPGAYVERYMARGDATEPIFPLFGTHVDLYVRDYMLRGDAVVPVDGRGPMDGVAFTQGNPSMSARDVKSLSGRIQNLFESGHTVVKTVVSFDDDYLRETGVLPPGFVSRERGDKRGQLDQMRLRLAISHGMERMSHGFDDLVWVATLQYDTMHMHAHIAMVDAGKGRLRPDGEQRGMLSQADMSLLRRGIDSELTYGRYLRPYARQTSAERVRVRQMVTERATRGLEHDDQMSLIFAALPDDRGLWRASSKRPEMSTAISLARRYVRQIVSDPAVGWSGAVSSVERYADARASREGLSRGEREELVATGVARMEDACVGAVFDVLRDSEPTAAPSKSAVANAILISGEDMDVPASPLSELCYRVRSWSSRIDEHKKYRERFHDARVAYEATEDVAPESEAAFLYYQTEERYQSMALAKYQYLLPLAAWGPDRTDEVRRYLGHLADLQALEAAWRDPVMRTLDAYGAETWGIEAYGQRGCGLAVSAPQLFQERIERVRGIVRREREELDFRLSGDGLVLDCDLSGPRPRGRLRREPAHDFEEVKACDLHDMRYDFDHEVRVPQMFITDFVALARERRERYLAARDYFVGSGQPEVVSALPGRDVMAMSEFADLLGETPSLPTLRGTGSGTSGVRAGRGLSKQASLEGRARIEIAREIGDFDISDLEISR